MATEYEGKILNPATKLREQIKKLGGKKIYPRTLFQRVMFDNQDLKNKRSWIRLRTEEGGRITLTLKRVEENSLEGVKEWEVEVNSFEQTKELLEQMGFASRNFQESKRERWELLEATIDFDTWPQLEEFVEIEAKDKETVLKMIETLGISEEELVFDNVDEIYKQKGVDIYKIDRLTFDKTEQST